MEKYYYFFSPGSDENAKKQVHNDQILKHDLFDLLYGHASVSGMVFKGKKDLSVMIF